MKLELDLDERALDRAIGEAVAAAVRARLRSGLGAKGSLPPPDDHENPPLDDTGELIRSIKFVPGTGKAKGRVMPTGVRVNDRGRSNAMVLRALLRARPDLRRSSPLGATAAERREAIAAAKKEITRQAHSGRARVRRR